MWKDMKWSNMKRSIFTFSCLQLTCTSTPMNFHIFELHKEISMQRPQNWSILLRMKIVGIRYFSGLLVKDFSISSHRGMRTMMTDIREKVGQINNDQSFDVESLSTHLIWMSVKRIWGRERVREKGCRKETWGYIKYIYPSVAMEIGSRSFSLKPPGKGYHGNEAVYRLLHTNITIFNRTLF